MAYKLGKAIAQTISEHTQLSANQPLELHMTADRIRIKYGRHAGTHIEIRECVLTGEHQKLIYDRLISEQELGEAGELGEGQVT